MQGMMSALEKRSEAFSVFRRVFRFPTRLNTDPFVVGVLQDTVGLNP